MYLSTFLKKKRGPFKVEWFSNDHRKTKAKAIIPTNHNSSKRVTCSKCGKNHACMVWLVLVLILIGWKTSASFLSQSLSVAIATRHYFRRSLKNCNRTGTSDNREFKKLRRLLQRKRHMKIGLCISLSVSRLFQVDHVIQNRRIEVRFRCLGTNGFHAKEKNERFTAASGSRCRQNLKTERKNFTSSFCTCSTIIFPHSTNQITDLWRCR